MNILYVVLLSLALSWMLSEFLAKMKLPRVLSPILVGVLFGIKPIKEVLINPDTTMMMSSLADIGLIFLMFYVGFDINLKNMFKTGRQSVLISLLCIASEFSLGFLVGKLFGFSNLVSVILGATMSVSAEAIAVNILEETGTLRSKIGTIVVAAGIIDNIVEILMIAFIVTFTTKGAASSPFMLFFYAVLLAIVIAVIYRYILPRVLLIAEKNEIETNMFMLSVIMALIFSVLSELLGFGFVIGSLLAGIVMNRAIEKHGQAEYISGKRALFKMSMAEFNELKNKMAEHDTTLNAIKTISFGFLVPFFFIWIGLNVDLAAILENPVFVVVLTIAAFAGMLFGATLGNVIGGGSAGEGFIVGWALNSRGSVELVFAEIARANNVISSELFSSIVFMTLFTTLLSPVMFKYLVLRKKLGK